MAVAVDRRKSVLWVGIAIVIAMLLPIEAIYLARYPYTNAIRELGSIDVPAAQAVYDIVYDIVFKQLVTFQRNVLIFGLILWAGAVVAGPAKWAVALRGGVQHGMQGVGTAWDFGAFGEWVLARKQGLRSIGVVAGVLALLFWHIGPAERAAWVGVLVLVWLLAIEFFGRPRPEPADVAQKPSGGEPPPGEEEPPGM